MSKPLNAAEKAAVTASCDRFIAEILKPRFLPAILPTTLSYPIDIFGKWRGSKYSFITCFCSGSADNKGETFESAFTRLDHLAECVTATRFDVMWRRHTGQWHRLFSSVTLDEALRLIETEELLQPAI